MSKDLDVFVSVIIFCRVEMGSVPILKADHHRPASETPFKWRFAGGLMMDSGDGVTF